MKLLIIIRTLKKSTCSFEWGLDHLIIISFSLIFKRCLLKENNWFWGFLLYHSLFTTYYLCKYLWVWIKKELLIFFSSLGLPWCSVGKESACNSGDPGSIPGSGRSAGEGIGYPFQYSWASLVAQLVKHLPAMQETWVQSLSQEDPLEKRKATHRVTKSRTQLNDFHFHFFSSLGVTLCDPVDCSSPGSSVHGSLQARILEWVAIFFSRGSSWPWDWTWVSCTAGRLFTDWATREALGDTEGIKQIIILSPFPFFIISYSGWIIFCKKVLLVLKTFFLLLKMF